ncbi:MAG: CHAT domain-containing tetratricopeptide repeat protein [Blastomonas sp.]
MKFEGLRILAAAMLAATTGPVMAHQAGEQAGPGDSGAEQSLEDRLLALKEEGAQADPAAAAEEGKALLAEAEGRTDISPLARARLLSYVATSVFYLNDISGALAYFEQARDVLEAGGLGTSDDILAILNNIGSAQSALGNHDAALAIKQDVLGKMEARYGRQSGEYADALFGIGLTRYRMSDIDAALIAITEAVEIKNAASAAGGEPDPNVAIYWMSLAAVLNQVGKVSEGIEAARGAARWAEDNLGPDHLVTAAALHNFGAILNAGGRFAEAEPILRRTMAIREKLIGREHPDMAITMNGLAFSLEHLGGAKEAETLYLAAAAIYEANPDSGAPQSAGVILLNAANIAAGRGEWDVARERRARSLAMLEERVNPNHPALARALYEMGLSDFHDGHYDAALAGLGRASEIYATRAEPYEAERVRAGILRGYARLRLGGRDEGLAVASESYVAARDYLFNRAVAESEQVRTEADYADSLALFAQLAFEAGDSETGLEALQVARMGDLELSARALAVRAAAEDERTAALVRNLQDINQQANRLRSDLSRAVAASDEQAVATIEASLNENRAALEDARAELVAAFPQYRDIGRPAPLPLGQLSASLGAEDGVLIVQPTLDGLLSVAITRDGLQWSAARKKTNEFADWVGAIRASIDAQLLDDGGDTTPFALDAASGLYQAIFSTDIADALNGRKRLNVFAGSYLSALPFSLLVSGMDGDRPHWLLRDHAIVTPLALGELKAAPAEERRTLRFAGIGGPVLTPPGGDAMAVATLLRGGPVDPADIRELPSLPGAEQELKRMARLFRDSDNLVLTGAEATEAAVKSRPLEGYSVLAFATHGLIGGAGSGLDQPALVLTPPEQADALDDGMLTASEIAALRLDADWVILSACSTAAGMDGGAPAYSGLAQAFVFAGARSLLLSHWPVRDDAAAKLSVETVRGAAEGLDRAEALRQAQLKLMDDPDIAGGASPAIWAPFILIGG